MKISEIHLETNKKIETPHLIQLKDRFVANYLFRVSIDNLTLWERAIPFHFSEDVIELEADMEYLIWGDGQQWIWSRLFGDFVIWFAPLKDIPGTFYLRGIETTDVYVFDKQQYFENVGVAFDTVTEGMNPIESRPHLSATVKLLLRAFVASLLDLRRAYRILKYNFHDKYLPPKHRKELPSTISQLEIAKVLQRNFPEHELSLYTIPELDDDSMGRKIVQAFESYLKEDVLTDSIEPIDATTLVELRIGLDKELEGYPECKWLIGESKKGLAICFLSLPTFPLFITSPQIDKILKRFI